MHEARPRLFVSHSSCDDAACGCVGARNEVVALVEHSGVTAVVDADVLQSGDVWHATLMSELINCSGCLVLLSPHALKSEYVKEEASVAKILHAYSRGHFAVLPVLLDGVTRSDLESSTLARLKLTDHHLVTWPDATGRRTHRQLEARLEALASERCLCDEPMVHEVVSVNLERAHRSAVEECARLLDLPRMGWFAHLPAVVALDMLRERLIQLEKDPLRRALKRVLPTVPSFGRMEVVNRVLPFARIPRDAAGKLRDVAVHPSRRIAVLPARRDETPELFLRRVSMAPEIGPPFTPTGGGPHDYTTGLIDEIRRYVAEQLGFTEDDQASDAELDAQLREREDDEGLPVTVVIRADPDPDLTQRLVRTFPRVLFLFASDTDEHAGETVIPGLPATQETALVVTYRDLRKRFH
jgi:hypothetical protein